MSLMDALVVELRADATVGGLVSSRVYHVVAPQGVSLPYITLNTNTTDHEHHQGAAAGLVDARMQIASWADSHNGAETLADGVREALDGFDHDTLGSGSYTSAAKRVSLVNDADTYIPPTDASDIGIFGVIQEYRVWHTESVPTFA